MKKFDFGKIKKFVSENLILVLLLIMVIYVGITQDNFFTWRNFNVTLSSITPRFIIALGISGCLIIKGTDLSAGRAVGITAVLSACMLQPADYIKRVFPASFPELPIFVVAAMAIAAGAVFGFLNGVTIAKLKLPPFLATLGMQTIIYGICCVAFTSEPVGGLRDDFLAITTKNLVTNKTPNGFYFKTIFLVAIAAFLIFWFLYNKTRYGKYMYAIGGNENAAEVSGINVDRQKIIIYTLAGAMYGLAGFIFASKNGGCSVNTGYGYECEAIAACTIGGVASSGGVGKVSGILLGVCVFELLKTSMQFLGINPFIQQIIQGIVIIVAVAFDIRKYIKKK